MAKSRSNTTTTADSSATDAALRKDSAVAGLRPSSPAPAAPVSQLTPWNAMLVLALSVAMSTLMTTAIHSSTPWHTFLQGWAGTEPVPIHSGHIKTSASSRAALYTKSQAAELIRLAKEDPDAYLARYECRSSYSVRILHRAPLVMLIEDFLQPGEAEHVMRIAQPRMKASTVTQASDNYYAKSQARTSSSAFLDAQQDKVVSCIEMRAANLSQVKLKQCEPLQVVHYLPSQEYKPHYDYFDHDKLTDSWAKRTGQRYVTILPYLSDERDGLEGGATAFPAIGLEVKPKKNAAAMWYNLDPNDKEDAKTLHAGTPVIAGSKTAINIWIRKFTPYLPVREEDSDAA